MVSQLLIIYTTFLQDNNLSSMIFHRLGSQKEGSLTNPFYTYLLKKIIVGSRGGQILFFIVILLLLSLFKTYCNKNYDLF